MGTASDDPRDIEQRIGWIKESISSRVTELGRRVERVRDITDVKAAVAEHPWIAVGAGLALGLAFAMTRPRRDSSRSPGIIGTSMRAMLVSVAASYARTWARNWVEQQLHPELGGRAPAHGVSQPLPHEPREAREPVH
jgi:hypothetical protein